MESSAVWQTWRAALLPAVTRTLCGSVVPASLRSSIPRTRQTLRLRQVRYVSSSHARRSEKSTLNSEDHVYKDIKERKDELDRSGIEKYPRIYSSERRPTLNEYIVSSEDLEHGETRDISALGVAGRVSAIRKSGSKLAFIDIYEEPGHHKLQLMLDLGHMNCIDKPAFSDFVKLIRRGDVISANGSLTRTRSGELSLRVDSLPTILSPCLHKVPLTSYQSQTASSMDIDLPDRHVEMLTDPSVISTLVIRSKVLKVMRQFFDSHDFLEVQTPILAAAAGGATARPFETTATGFSDRKLSLRIAPELWLKRLILGGMSRVYEIGPSFRNEGLDKTHNPEFTTCEFYGTYINLARLQSMTGELIRALAQAVNASDPDIVLSSQNPAIWNDYPEIDFIPALNDALGQPLPHLGLPDARDRVLEIFKSRDIPVPAKPTLPRLLDKLCSRYLEPQCESFTWIVNTPECLSPLAKSFVHPNCPNDQPVAARAELFINQREVINCYEEENSPFEQRRKFIDQQRYARHLPPSSALNSTEPAQIEHLTGIAAADDEAHKIDHDYLRALEWGLPPTGGWGCGIDRLVMLFAGKEKISDVLSFGNLRAVTRGAEKWNANEEAKNIETGKG